MQELNYLDMKQKLKKCKKGNKMTNEKTSLNQKIERLDNEVEWFYSDDFKLEEAMDKYKAAVELAKEIKSDLENLKNEIEVLAEDFSK